MFPSGEQIELRVGEQRVVVVEVGGGLRSYEVGDRAVLDGYAADELSSAGRGQVLMPWPNRLEDGSYEFEGRSHRLPLTEPETGNAIHGLVRWVAWRVAERDEHRVVLKHTLHPQPGYPFSLALQLEYALSADGLTVTSTAANIGTDTCPFGSGAHAYLTAGTATVDPVVLQAPGATVLQVDERGIPTGSSPVDGSPFDFRTPKAIGATKLDHAYTDLERDDDGRARVVLQAPDGGATVTLWLDESFGYLQLFTGDSQPSVARRSIAVEPMTCPPNAFRTGEALTVLAPGERTAARWGIRPA